MEQSIARISADPGVPLRGIVDAQRPGVPRSRHHALLAIALPLLGGALACVLALPVTGCVGSPLPEPPTLSPESIAVDPRDCISCDHAVFDLRGLPGAVTPGADVVLTVLDRTEPPLVRRAESDGSFFANVTVFPGDEIRIQARLDGRYSMPVDIVATPDATELRLAMRPLAGCFVVTPTEERVLAPGESTSALVENRCTSPITLSRASARTSELGVVVEGLETPLELGVGVSRAVRILVPDTAVAGEELVLFETDAPARDRRTVLVVVAP